MKDITPQKKQPVRLNNKLMQVFLGPKMKKELKIRAAMENASISSLVRSLIENYLNNSQKNE